MDERPWRERRWGSIVRRMQETNTIGVDAADAAFSPGARAKPSPVGPVDWARVVGASALLTGLVVGAMWVVRMLPDSGVAPAVLAFVLGLVVLPVVASPLEWFVHRFVYHQAVFRPLGAIYTVHTAHHYAFFPTWRYVTAGPARRLSIRRRAPDAHTSGVRNAAVRLAHFGWYMTIGAVVVWLPAWLVTSDVAFLAGLVVATVVVSNLFIVVHDTIHRPGSHRIVEAQPWFAFLDRHHYIHHVALGANLNFLLPLADLLFGTLRTAMTADEIHRHGRLEAAKTTLVGEGERARAATS
jgi:multisubunit Na+/H+ antiporter MnhB subunit